MMKFRENFAVIAGEIQRRFLQQSNLTQIRAELQPLLDLKEALDAMEKLEQIVVTVERRLRSRP